MKKTTPQVKQGQCETLDTLYKNAFRYMPGYIYLLDKDCMLINCNDALLERLGLDTLPQPQMGALYKAMTQAGLWTEEQIKVLKKADIDAIVSGDVQQDQPQLPVIDKKGQITSYHATRIPLFGPHHDVEGLLVMLRDVTEHKRLTEQLDVVTQQLQTQNAHPTSRAVNHYDAAPRKTPPRILIVEDNPIAQRAAQAILMNNDCLVDIADNETRFHELFVPGKYDLVLMDIGLENTSGYVMAKQLRLREKDTEHHVPIIALTGFDADLVRFDCDYYQMDGVIAKPLTAEQVKQIIQHYIFHINLEITGLKSARFG